LAWTLPEATAQELTRQIAEGMLFIWSKGCVHRDLKPANVLLAGRPGEPLVAKVKFMKQVGLHALLRFTILLLWVHAGGGLWVREGARQLEWLKQLECDGDQPSGHAALRRA
jgi:hypothetical protein